MRSLLLLFFLLLAAPLASGQFGPGGFGDFGGGPPPFGPPPFGPDGPPPPHRHHHHHRHRPDDDGGMGGGGGPPQAGFGGQPGGGFNLGDALAGLMGGNPNALNQLSQAFKETINGISRGFFAPPPTENGIPPHVLRRAIRFCRRRPQDPRCQQHPEWANVQGDLPGSGPGLDLGDVFPGLLNFRLPPIPQLNLRNILANVPKDLVAALPPALLANFPPGVKNVLLSRCANGACRKQKPENLNLRASIAEREAAIRRSFGGDQNQIDQEIEIRMARTHQLKKAMLKKAGLDSQIEASDDGVFQNDILLTEDQANRLINQVNNPQAGQMPVPGGGGPRGRRSAVFLEENFARAWPTDRPIQFMFDPQLSAAERGHIQKAIAEIQAKTCVKFQQVNARPAGNYIYYSKWTVGGFCGLAHIGMKTPSPNLVYLSFNCGNEWGIALHETLHALGLNHEQLRSDRDQYITINWENVDPHQFDFFAISDAREFTSYGVPYDYGSIMHYSSTINTQNPGRPTMSAKINPAVNNGLMGQRRGMSQNDVLLLKKMYCEPGCPPDGNVYCGAWANTGYCANSQWLQSNCQKSCNRCGDLG